MNSGSTENNMISEHDIMREGLLQATYERILLSRALNDMDHFYNLVTKVDHGDFLHPKHAIIYNTLKALHTKGWEKFDLDIITNEMQANSDLEFVGGSHYIQAIKNMPVSEENFQKALGLVLDASTKYQVYCKLKGYIESVGAKDLTGTDLINIIENDMLDLSTESKAIQEPRDVAIGLKEYLEERRENKVEMSGITTDYPILDRQIDGLIPGTLMIVAARKKMGKSALLTNIATRVAFKHDIPVLYIDTEMTFNEWRDRVLACLSKVEERKIKHGRTSDIENQYILNRCLKVMEEGKLFHEYMPGYSVEKVSTLYKKYKIKHNIGLGIFDYIKEPDSSGNDRNRKEYQLLGDITTKLKDLAGKLDIPFLTAAQLNRDGDVADSDRVARYGDIVAHWMQRHPDEKEANPHGTFKLVIKDTRRGGSTALEGITYVFNKSTVGITEIPADKQMIQYHLSKGEEVLDDINKGNYEDADLQ